MSDADSFFVGLDERVMSLADLSPPHPLTAKVAVATLKRYLADPRHTIRLHDLIADELASIEEQTTVEAFPVGGVQIDNASYIQRVEKYEAICSTLVAMMGVGGYWATEQQRSVFLRALERLGSRWTEPQGGLTALIDLADYPATLALYGGGIGAVAGEQLETLSYLLGTPAISRRTGRRSPLIHEVAPSYIVHGEVFQPPHPQGQRYTPVSDRLSEVLREPLRDTVTQDGAFLECFDRFEYLLTLAFIDLAGEEGIIGLPVGSCASSR